MKKNAAKDLFSEQASDYAKFRPTYPDELFQYLATLTESKQLLWDCGTGNGQVAYAMSDMFEQIVATDLSQKQIDFAKTKDNIEYKVASAENSLLDDHSVDMVTVAQALHWFDFDTFNQEVKRVLKPSGVIAVWCYQHFTAQHAALNEITQEFYHKTTKPYWAPERKHIDEGYANIPFPYREINTPTFEIKREMHVEDILNFHKTWSPINTLIKDTGENLVETWLRPRLEKLSLTDPVVITWPIIMRVGYVA